MTSPPQLLLRVAAFAAERHRNQRRKDPHATPYINHPLQVAAVLANQGGVTDQVLLAAALLHDTVEDTRTTPEEIEREFGRAIRELVDEVTDEKSLPKTERKQRQIERARASSPAAKQLKLADKICNVGDVGSDSPLDWSLQRKLDYVDWAERVVAGCRGANAELEKLFDETAAAARQRLREQLDSQLDS